ncbi:hypothetical protein CDO73_09230 [Saccharibacillus sp. O23]|nr:hypothetical protein CDO73_09230 [Saccharibacillus sp. O23]
MASLSSVNRSSSECGRDSIIIERQRTLNLFRRSRFMRRTPKSRIRSAETTGIRLAILPIGELALPGFVRQAIDAS